MRAPEAALRDALERLELLQRTLHRRLTLNRRDPPGQKADFAELDAMADLLWPPTEPETV